MANNIDNKVVAMKFENRDFEQKINQTIISLDKLTKALTLTEATKGFTGVTAAAAKVDLSSISVGIDKVNWAFIAFKASFEQVFRTLTTMAMDTGSKIVKALTIDGAMAGFNEYELKMGAIQTMMAGTGESLATVNKYLEELNAYSDKTIYSFSDMTQNIGKFTNAGIKLPVAVAAIKGVANVAALSGANAEEASRAMYNFGQAIGAGYVKLVDWKSIEFANMGTLEFKTQLLDAAVAAGTVEKKADGMYKAIGANNMGSKMKNASTAVAMFTEGLEYQWLTTDVLTKVLNDYSDETTNIGKRASKAATEIKTFTMMMDTTREAIGSGWSQTWEAISGDKDEATKLWTDVANGIQSIIGPSTQARIEMFNFLNAAGGRSAVINGLTNILKSLGMILAPIGKAFSEVFPPATSTQILQLTLNFEKFTKKLIPTAKLVENITKVFKGYFSIISLLWKGIGFVVNVIKTFVSVMFSSEKAVGKLSSSLGSAVVSFFDFFTNLNDAAKKSQVFETALAKLRDGFVKVKDSIKGLISGLGQIQIFNSEGNKLTTNMFDGLKNAIMKYFEVMSKVRDKILEVLGPVGKAIKDAFAGLSFDNVMKVIGTALAGGALVQFSKFVSAFTGFTKTFSGTAKDFVGLGKSVTDKITGIFDGLTGVLKGMQTNLNANALKSIAVAVAILAGSMMLISLIKPERLKGAMLAISLLLTEVMGIMAGFSKVSGDVAGINKAAVALGIISGALILMSVAVNRLGSLDTDTLVKGLEAVGILLGEMGLFSKLVSTDQSMIATGAGLILFSVAMLLMSKSLESIGAMDTGNLVKALVALGSLFTFVLLFGKLVKPGDMVSASVNMVLLSVGIAVMAGALKLLGGMSLAEVGIALVAMAGGLAILVIALNLLPKDLGTSALSLLIAAGAILILGIALKQLGSMSWDAVAVSLTALTVALLAIGLFLWAVGSNPLTLVGAAALLVVSGALVVLAMALGTLGGLSVETLTKGLVAMAVAFIIIGVAGYALTAALPGLLGFAAALLLIGVAVFLAGLGIGLFAAGIGVLAVALAAGGQVILAFLVQLSEQLPILAFNLAKALGAFALGLVQQQTAITAALISMFTSVLTALTALVPQILVFLSGLITGIVNLLVEKIPEIADAIMQLLVAILDTIQKYLPKIAEKAGDIAVAWINGLAEYYSRIAEAGANFIIKVLGGIQQQMNRIADAAMKTVIAFIEGLTRSINENGARFDSAAKGLIEAVFNRAKNLIGTAFNFAELGKSMADGIKDGLMGAVGNIATAARNLVQRVFGAAKEESQTNSPSKLFMIIGASWAEGMVLALVKNTKDVVAAGKNMVTSAYSAMTMAANRAGDILAEVVNPTITPVVDLDSVRKGAKAISSLMSNTPALQMAGAVSASLSQTNGRVGSNSTDAGVSKSEVNFTQNNYSPKPLSRLEIYRQTNNQLRAVQF